MFYYNNIDLELISNIFLFKQDYSLIIAKIYDESFGIEYLILRIRYSPRRYPCACNSPQIGRPARPNTRVSSRHLAIRAQCVF